MEPDTRDGRQNRGEREGEHARFTRTAEIERRGGSGPLESNRLGKSLCQGAGAVAGGRRDLGWHHCSQGIDGVALVSTQERPWHLSDDRGAYPGQGIFLWFEGFSLKLF